MRPCRRFLCIVLLLTAAIAPMTGCGVLSEEEAPVRDSVMVDVLVDLHLASARQGHRIAADSLAAGPDYLASERLGTTASATSASTPSSDSVLAAHNLDRSAFEEAMTYYVDHPAVYGKLYDAVIERLSIERYARSDTLHDR